jgi:hypothetical protein
MIQDQQEQTEETEKKLKLVKGAIHHVLNAIVDDPRGTESWAQRTAAAAALWNMPVEKVRADFQPQKKTYARYCEERERNEKLLTYCREHGITC